MKILTPEESKELAAMASDERQEKLRKEALKTGDSQRFIHAIKALTPEELEQRKIEQEKICQLIDTYNEQQDRLEIEGKELE
jgi:hypothetical protein